MGSSGGRNKGIVLCKGKYTKSKIVTNAGRPLGERIEDIKGIGWGGKKVKANKRKDPELLGRIAKL